MLHAENNSEALALIDPASMTDTYEHSEVFIDPSGKVTIDELIASKTPFHTPLKQDSRPSLGLTTDAYWIKTSVVNHLRDHSKWFINTIGSPSKQVSGYVVFDKERAKIHPLTVYPNTRGRTYILNLDYLERAILYIRIKDTQLPLNIGVSISSGESFLQEVTTTHIFYGLLMGGLLILSLYNFLYFIHLREAGFLSLAAFIFSFTIEMAGHMGWLEYFPAIRDKLSYVGAFFAFTMIATGMHQVIRLANLKEYINAIYLAAKALMYTAIFLALISPFINFGTSIAGLLGLPLLLLVAISFVCHCFKKIDIALSAAISILLFLISMLPTILVVIGWLDIDGYITDLSALALLISLTLLSLTQAERTRRREKAADYVFAASQAKDEFLTTMSHELRTPMNAVIGAARVLKLTSLSVEQKEYVSRLNTSSNHMIGMINDILDLARVENQGLVLEKQAFDLAEITKNLEQLLIDSCQQKNLTLEIINNVSILNKQMIGDAVRLQQVLLNLLHNATKFTQQGSIKLLITLLDVNTTTASIQFEVIDTGIGISKEQQETLFNPFTQAESSTSRQYGGSGLGLAICDRLVSSMGGKITVDSTLNLGSRFSFNLDFPLELVSQSASQPSAAFKEDLTGLKVLLVDDDEMNRFFGEKLLRVFGVEPSLAESGGQSIELLKQNQFDLVLMDVSMPDMDGYQTTQLIRQQLKLQNMPIIALTAHAIVGERERCLAAGMNDYLTKPFEIDDLKQILGYWHQTQVQQKTVGFGDK